MSRNDTYTLGIDIGSTTVKIAVLDSDKEVLFSDYERHFANIQEKMCIRDRFCHGILIRLLQIPLKFHIVDQNDFLSKMINGNNFIKQHQVHILKMIFVFCI